MLRSRYLTPADLTDEIKSLTIWNAENPDLILALVLRGLGWAELPMPWVHHHIADGTLLRLACSFQQSDELEGIDVVWTEQRALGREGQWIRDKLLNVSQDG